MLKPFRVNTRQYSAREFRNEMNDFSMSLRFTLQAEAALMYDVAKVILDSYSRLLKKNPNIFRNNFRRGEVYNNGTKGIDCRRVPVLPWEHGEKIARIFKKV